MFLSRCSVSAIRVWHFLLLFIFHFNSVEHYESDGVTSSRGKHAKLKRNKKKTNIVRRIYLFPFMKVYWWMVYSINSILLKSDHDVCWLSVLSRQYCVGIQDITRHGCFAWFFYNTGRTWTLHSFIYRITPIGFWVNLIKFLKWKENTIETNSKKERIICCKNVEWQKVASRSDSKTCTIICLIVMYRKCNLLAPTCWSEPSI